MYGASEVIEGLTEDVHAERGSLRRQRETVTCDADELGEKGVMDKHRQAVRYACVCVYATHT